MGMVIRETTGDRVFNAINYILLTLVVLIVGYPLYFVVIASISNPDMVNLGQVVIWPKDIMFTGYEYVANDPEIWMGYRNTVFYTTASTILSLSITLPAAYALSRKDFVFKGFFATFFMIPMFFSGGLIPFYLLIVQTLKIHNTIWVMIILGATNFMSIVIARTFFQSTIPEEMRESAEIDGCSNFRIFFQIVLPLSTAIIAVQALMFAVGTWNSFFTALMYLRGARNLWPLQLILRRILIESEIAASAVFEGGEEVSRIEFQRRAEQLKYALIVVANVPILIAYPFVQRYFVKGIMIGALKG